MMKIEVLYFEGCPNHREAVEMARSVAAECSVDAVVEEVEVNNQADAERLRFLGSPSFHVDGVDIDPEGWSRTDYAFSCRMYGGEGLPSRELLARAVSRHGPEPTPGTGGCDNGSHRCRGPQEPSDDTTPHHFTHLAGLAAAGGSVVSAVVASACCWLPLILIGFGLSASGVGLWFAKWRPLFLVVAVILIGMGFYLIYLRRPVCKPGLPCAEPSPEIQRFNRVMFWAATVVVVGFSLFPSYVGYFMNGNITARAGTDNASTVTLTLPIEGMTCEACAGHIQSELAKVQGVRGASVSYPDSRAVVTIDSSSPPSQESLIEAIRRVGYNVTSKP